MAPSPETPLNIKSQVKPLHHLPVYLAAILVIAALLAAFYLIASGTSLPPPPIITTTPTTNFTKFASSLTLPLSLQRVYASSQSDTHCYVPTTSVYIYYSQPGLGATIQQINYSAINQTEPIVVLLSVLTFNESYSANFSREFNAMSGYCQTPSISIYALESNTTYSHKQMNFSGIRGYLWSFSNFTDAGLALTQVNYTPDSRPNITMSIASVLYKNYNIRVSIWTLAGHMNLSALAHYTNLTVDAFKNKYS